MVKLKLQTGSLKKQKFKESGLKELCAVKKLNWNVLYE